MSRKPTNVVVPRGSLRLALVLSVLFASWALVTTACGDSSVSDPFAPPDAGADGDADTDADAAPEAGDDAGEQDADEEPGLGGPCLDDEQCDDGLDCTLDVCDEEMERCRHTPRDELCEDDVYCDGSEVCDLALGCIEGAPVSCSDDMPCTIDRCVESTRTCEHEPRDADGDGDPVWNCQDGGDCNDEDPRVSSDHEEVCNNGTDDDCDEVIDEDECTNADFDTCDEPLRLSASGSVALSFLAAGGDYALSCAEDDDWIDLAIELTVADTASDVDVLIESDDESVVLGAQANCGEAESEWACAPSYESVDGARMARLRLRDLEPGSYWLIASASGEGEAVLHVDFDAPSEVPANETCGTAELLVASEPVEVYSYDALADHESACESALGELVYRFVLQEASDVHLYAAALDGWGDPTLSLRDSDCVPASSELTCRGLGGPAHLFARNLSPGEYYVFLSATAPTPLSLLLELQPPSEAPEGEDCESAPTLEAGSEVVVDLDAHSDAVAAGCLPGSVDGALELKLDESSDVLLVQSFAEGDIAALGLAEPACSPADLLACESSDQSPLRNVVDQVPAGNYRVVSESAQGSSVSVAAFTRPAVAPTLVALADTCETALVIPETGGRFIGNTAQTNADHAATCDRSTVAGNGAPDQVLSLTLSEARRVIMDMRGSSYKTLLEVRRGPQCPGETVRYGCAPSLGFGVSYLDLDLEAGQYYVYVDGYDGDKGPWQLDVFTGKF